MTSTFEFDATNRVICWRMQGNVTEGSFIESMRMCADVLAETEPRGGIIDFSLVTSFEVPTDVIRMVADNAPLFPSLLIRVIVAPGNHVFGIARMFSMLSEHTRTNTHVVRSMGDAYKLLGVERPEFKAMGLTRKAGS